MVYSFVRTREGPADGQRTTIISAIDHSPKGQLQKLRYPATAHEPFCEKDGEAATFSLEAHRAKCSHSDVR